MIKTSSNKYYIKIYFVIFIFIIFLIFLNILFEDIKHNYSLPTLNKNIDQDNNSKYYSINNFEIIHTKLDTYRFEAIPNFNKNYTSQEIIDKNKCNIIFNGSFYNENFEPLGLYYYDNNQIGDIKKNNIFNGVLSLNRDGVWDISPSATYFLNKSNIFAIQSGPLLVMDSKFIDNPVKEGVGRRVVFVLDEYHHPSILVVYNKIIFNDGPNFKDLMVILKTLNNEKGINIFDAINLDGGNSSLYIDDKISLKENAFSGSYFCFYK